MKTVTVTERQGARIVRTETQQGVKPYEAFQVLAQERTAFFGQHQMCGQKRGHEGAASWDEWTAPSGHSVRVEIA